MRTTNPLVRLFGRSPFRPVQEHMEVVEQCAEAVVPLFEALRDHDQEALLRHKQQIFDLENKADELKNDIRAHLPKSLFMPVDRRDLLDLLNAQDSIADVCQDIAGLLSVRKMEIPESLTDGLFPFIHSNVKATRQCRKVISELDELLEMGFRGRRVDRVIEMIEDLNRLETETDRHEMKLTEELFQLEDEMKPLSVVFWYELFRLIADIADYAEDVGDRLRLLIAR